MSSTGTQLAIHTYGFRVDWKQSQEDSCCAYTEYVCTFPPIPAETIQNNHCLHSIYSGCKQRLIYTGRRLRIAYQTLVFYVGGFKLGVDIHQG